MTLGIRASAVPSRRAACDVISFLAIEVAEVLHGQKCVGMLRPQSLRRRFQDLGKHCFGSREPAFRLINDSQIVQGRERAEVLSTEPPALGFNYIGQQGFSFCELALRRIE